MVSAHNEAEGFDEAEFIRRRNKRNVAIAWGIVAFVLLVFLGFIARFNVPKSVEWGDQKTISTPNGAQGNQSEPTQNGGK